MTHPPRPKGGFVRRIAEPLDLRTALFTVHKDGSQHKPQLARRPSAKGYGVRALKTIPSPSKRYSNGHSCRYVRPRFE